MESFEDLGALPHLVEALAAEGIEAPTAFQAAALPVIRRGNNLVAGAGPGAGTLVAYGIPLLERLPVGEGAPVALVLTPSRSAARRLAESLARFAQGTGHTVGALGSAWALPERTEVLFATPDDLVDEVEGARLKLGAVAAVVVDGAAAIQHVAGLDRLETLLEAVPSDAQRVIVSLPLTPEVEDLAERHLRRSVHVPPRRVDEGAPEVPDRGRVRWVVAGEPREDTLVTVVAEHLEEGARHVVVFVRSEIRAADVGDFLTLHGFVAGAPGDASSPVWLAVDDRAGREAREAADDPEAVVPVSYDVPSDPDVLDRRHGGGAGGTVLVLAREIPHLQDVAARTGYTLVPAPIPRPESVDRPLDEVRKRVQKIVDEGNLAGEYLVLEPLFDVFHPAEVAAALLRLVEDRLPVPSSTAAAPRARGAAGAAVPPETAWARLFVSVGERDGAGPGDLLGAISGEAGVDGSKVGKIELRDTFSLVEVRPDVAERVIRALNGTTIRGRSARVDYDRGASRRGGGAGGRGGGRGGRKRGGR